MQGFSRIDQSMAQFEQDHETKKALLPAEVWSAEEGTPQKRDERIERCSVDFWDFDRTYFTPEMHTGGHAEPAEFHHELLEMMTAIGIDVVIGPRDHAKSAYALKMGTWLLLTGRVTVGGTYSNTLPMASRLLSSFSSLLTENLRIRDDWGVEMLEDNEEQFRFRTRGDRRVRIMAAFSEGRSVRGYTYLFGRPQLLIGDDIETLSSPLGPNHATDRIDRVSEAWASMEKDNRSIVWLANNFDVRCSVNSLKVQQEKGVLEDHIRVHHYRAWDGKPLWPQRFPAKSEKQMRRMVKPKDEKDWRGNYQGDPIEESGDQFPRDKYAEYAELPPDARGVAWCDPNLSKKGKGDTTAMGALLYSPSLNTFYVAGARCRSYSGSGDLLDDYFTVKEKVGNVFAMGFDGHVSQESTWSDHVINWCRINQGTYPRLEYRKYNVDLLAKTVSAVYQEGRILFEPGFRETKEGKRFTEQLFAFAGKKAGKMDDAADFLCCAYELIHERGLAVPKREGDAPRITIVNDPFTF